MIVSITDDFDLDRIAESGQCFRWTKIAEHLFRIVAGSACLYVTELGEGEYDLDCTEAEYRSFWYMYFDLEEDYSRIREVIDPEEDLFLWQAAENEKGIRILRQDPWEMLISFIISQNKNIPAIRRSVEMLSRSCGEKKTDARGCKFYTFPLPEAVLALTEKDLSACSLGYRCKYVHAAAEAVVSGNMDLKELMTMDEESVMKTLTGLYGVGTKVASCVALFGLHRLNAFPVDVWIRRILSEKYPGGYPFERYSPYNGIYQQYMFAYYRHINEPASGGLRV